MTKNEALIAMIGGFLIKHKTYLEKSYCFFQTDTDKFMFNYETYGVEHIVSCLEYNEGYEIYTKKVEIDRKELIRVFNKTKDNYYPKHLSEMLKELGL